MTEPTAAAPKRKRRWLRNTLSILGGLFVGLGLAEVVFRVRDQKAFPHLNVYVADAELGARLRPGATQYVSFQGNPVTHVRINSDGYRGAEWPAAAAGEVVVVGDSQVFGLGVEETQTFATVLAETLPGKPVVRNLGVPTYGPREYTAVLAESLAKRPAATVIYVVNIANDLFEATRPNKERHAIWDGWAVRKEHAPADVMQFPGRQWLFRDSHAVYALRGYAYRKGPQDSGQGVASEGSFADIAAAATTEQSARDAAKQDVAATAKAQADELAKAFAELKSSERKVSERYSWDLLFNPPKEFETTGECVDGAVTPSILVMATHASPGDIVTVHGGGEFAREARVNAEHIRRGALLRLQLEKQARERATIEKDKSTLDTLDARELAAKRVDALKAFEASKPKPVSPLTEALRDVQGVCAKHGAKLWVVALPLDVQVSAEEWKKYQAKPLDMQPTKVLLDDVVYAANSVGARGYDATQVLAAAEPGAFLLGDLHMTPKGHRALAEGIAKALIAPRVEPPAMGMPIDRSPPPTAAEWAPNTEIAVTESDPAGCETKRLREWIGVFCRGKGGAKGVRVVRGREVLTATVPGQAMLVAPVIAGQDLLATFVWDGSAREFSLKVDRDPVQAVLGFGKPLTSMPDGIAGADLAATDFCACYSKNNAGKACSAAKSLPDPACNRTYAGDCDKLLACAEGRADARAMCAEGEAIAGAAQRCAVLCESDAQCKRGHCVEWQGGKACL